MDGYDDNPLTLQAPVTLLCSFSDQFPPSPARVPPNSHRMNAGARIPGRNVASHLICRRRYGPCYLSIPCMLTKNQTPFVPVTLDVSDFAKEASF